MGSLMVLKQLASSRSMRQNIVDLKGKQDDTFFGRWYAAFLKL